MNKLAYAFGMNRLAFSIGLVAVTMLIAFFVGILPESPFLTYINLTDLHEYLAYINYFLPIDKLILISDTWLTCLVPWILSQHTLKAIKILGEYTPLT